jgi:hypothetical protein
MKTPTKLLLVYKNIHLPNKELAKMIYGEVNSDTLLKVRVLKHRAKKMSQKNNAIIMKSFIPITFSNSLQVSFKDLKHYSVISSFYHDSINDLNLRYLADVSRYINSRTLKDSHFEALLFEHLKYYANLFERNKKGNIKLYVDTKHYIIRGHHKNKAILYYIIIMIYCKYYKCPSTENKQLIKEVVFNENEDADDIIKYYSSNIAGIMLKELFL